MSKPAPDRTEPINPGPGWEFVGSCDGPGHPDAKRCPPNTRTTHQGSWVRIDPVAIQTKDRGSYSIATTSPYTEPYKIKHRARRVISLGQLLKANSNATNTCHCIDCFTIDVLCSGQTDSLVLYLDMLSSVCF